jgi:hypothetical protein
MVFAKSARADTIAMTRDRLERYREARLLRP